MMSLGTNLNASFDAPLNASTVTDKTVSLRDANGALIPATISYVAATNSVQLVPSVALEQSETFTASIKGGPSGIVGASGLPLPSNISWSFTTENFVNANAVSTPGVKIDRTSGLLTNAAGGEATFSMVLTAAPSSDVTIPLSSTNAAAGRVSESSVVFTSANWNIPQAVSVEGTISTTAAANVSYSVVVGSVISNDKSYNGINPTDVSLVNQAVNTRPLLEAAATSEAIRFVYSSQYAAAMPMTMTDGDMSAGMMSEETRVLALVPISSVTNTVIASGNWSDPSIWSNKQVPAAGANIWVMPGRTVTVDGVVATSLRTIRVSGELKFSTSANSGLQVDTIIVDQLGTFTAGTTDTPIPAGVKTAITFTDTGAIDRVWDPYGYSRGLISLGSASIVGAAKTSTAQLASTPAPGTNKLVLTTAPLNWRVGDLIDVPGTSGGQDEQFLITAISADGKTITVNTPVALVRDAPSEPGQSLSVANLTRNITFSSQAIQDTTHRGHVMFMHTSDEIVEYAAFNALGRTDFSKPINNAVVDKNGLLVPGTGTNPKGRYALHFHMTGTDMPMDPIMVVGDVVNDAVGWGFDNHSGNVDFENNVAYNTGEAGFATEAGNEIGTFNNNMAIRGGHVGFWLNGPYVTFTNNVATGFNATYGDGVMVWSYSNSDATGAPIYFDASKVMPQGGTLPVDPWAPAGELRTELLPFHLVNTQVYNSWGGIEIRAHQGDLGDNYRSTIDGGVIWDVQRGLTFNYATAVTTNNLALYGSGRQWESDGIYSDLGARELTFNNVTDVDWGTGFALPGSVSAIVSGGFFNNTVNFRIQTFDPGTAADLTSRIINISGVTYGSTLDPRLLSPSPNSTHYNVYLDNTATYLNQPLQRFLSDQIFVNGKQLYFLDQDANFVVNGTGNANYDGKTNAQLMAKYGIATRGVVIPSGASSDPLIFGAKVIAPGKTTTSTGTSSPQMTMHTISVKSVTAAMSTVPSTPAATVTIPAQPKPSAAGLGSITAGLAKVSAPSTLSHALKPGDLAGHFKRALRHWSFGSAAAHKPTHPFIHHLGRLPRFLAK